MSCYIARWTIFLLPIPEISILYIMYHFLDHNMCIEFILKSFTDEACTTCAVRLSDELTTRCVSKCFLIMYLTWLLTNFITFPLVCWSEENCEVESWDPKLPVPSFIGLRQDKTRQREVTDAGTTVPLSTHLQCRHFVRVFFGSELLLLLPHNYCCCN